MPGFSALAILYKTTYFLSHLAAVPGGSDPDARLGSSKGLV